MRLLKKGTKHSLSGSDGLEQPNVTDHSLAVHCVALSRPKMQASAGSPEQQGEGSEPFLYVCSGLPSVAEVPYMEGFICKRKLYVDAGRTTD